VPIVRSASIRYGVYDIPVYDCLEYEHYPPLNGYFYHLAKTIRHHYPTAQAQNDLFRRFFSRFYDTTAFAYQIKDYTMRLFSLALQCHRFDPDQPPLLLEHWRQFIKEVPTYSEKYKGIYPNETVRLMEAFFYHHGMRIAPPAVKDCVKGKAVIDIGACHGESAMILSQYGKEVHSFDISEPNYATCRQILRQNPDHAKKITANLMGISDVPSQIHRRTLSGYGISLQTVEHKSAMINITTVDRYAAQHQLKVGFVKADMEGYGMNAVKGALETLVEQRPAFGLSIYHTMDELFGIPMLLLAELKDYVFEFQMWSTGISDNDKDRHLTSGTEFELAFFGYPREANPDIGPVENKPPNGVYEEIVAASAKFSEFDWLWAPGIQH
jgi:FkbM family methyltransferase